MNYDIKTILGAIAIGGALTMIIYSLCSMACYAVFKDRKVKKKPSNNIESEPPIGGSGVPDKVFIK